MISIVIPSRNERFLLKTTLDLLAKAEGEIQVIVVLDGCLTEQVDDPRVTYIHFPEPRGMRPAINSAVAASHGRFIMKIDAHCMVDQGFDVKLAADCSENTVVIPRRKRLDADNWRLLDAQKQDVDYEFLSCPATSSDWRGDGLRGRPWNQRSAERINRNEYLIDETMSFQGSCWIMRRAYFDFLDLMDDTHYASFGGEAQEIGLKAWLSGGRVLTNKKTWYAHLHKGREHGRGYYVAKKEKERSRKFVHRWFSNSSGWTKQTLPLSWLVKRFSPVPSWPVDWKERYPECSQIPETSCDAQQPPKSVVYYTHNRREMAMFEMVQRQIKCGIGADRIVSVSSQPIDFGKNLVHSFVPDNGWLDMFEKILIGLENSPGDIIYLCEDDVLYHPSHFDFVPPRDDTYYYNVNVWKLRYKDGFCRRVDDCKQLSGLVAHRDLLIRHYRARVDSVRKNGFTRRNGFEPGTRSIRRGGYDNNPAASYSSTYPNIDIRHDDNATANRWLKSQFRNQKYTVGWQESNAASIPGWAQLPSPRNVVAKSI